MFKTLLTSFFCFWLLSGTAQEAAYGEFLEMQSAMGAAGTHQMNQLSATIHSGSRVMVSWKSADTLNDYFTIERSCNQRPFETVAVIRLQDSQKLVEWQDELPVAGRNVYRVTATLKDGRQVFGGITSIVLAGNINFKFYPNPADHILIVRSEFPADITIVDVNGKPRISLVNVSGLQLVNVAPLEKGVYLLRVYNRVLNTLSQERFVKN